MGSPDWRMIWVMPLEKGPADAPLTPLAVGIHYVMLVTDSADEPPAAARAGEKAD